MKAIKGLEMVFKLRDKSYFSKVVFICLVLVFSLSAAGKTMAGFMKNQRVSVDTGHLMLHQTNGNLVVKRINGNIFEAKIKYDAVIFRNGKQVSEDALLAGDIIKVSHYSDALKNKKAVSIYAQSPKVVGRIADLDLQERKITIANGSKTTYEFYDHLVVLIDGALSRADLVPMGSMVVAEFDGTDNPKIARLKIDK